MTSFNIVADDLKKYIEKIERLELDKIAIQEHVRDVYSDAEKNGFDVKTMKQIIKLRKMDNNDREEQEMLLEIYKKALGMVVEEDV